jgi:hypothetical protein
MGVRNRVRAGSSSPSHDAHPVRPTRRHRSDSATWSSGRPDSRRVPEKIQRYGDNLRRLRASGSTTVPTTSTPGYERLCLLRRAAEASRYQGCCVHIRRRARGTSSRTALSAHAPFMGSALARNERADRTNPRAKRTGYASSTSAAPPLRIGLLTSPANPLEREPETPLEGSLNTRRPRAPRPGRRQTPTATLPHPSLTHGQDTQTLWTRCRCWSRPSRDVNGVCCTDR